MASFCFGVLILNYSMPGTAHFPIFKKICQYLGWSRSPKSPRYLGMLCTQGWPREHQQTLVWGARAPRGNPDTVMFWNHPKICIKDCRSRSDRTWDGGIMNSWSQVVEGLNLLLPKEIRSPEMIDLWGIPTNWFKPPVMLLMFLYKAFKTVSSGFSIPEYISKNNVTYRH